MSDLTTTLAQGPVPAEPRRRDKEDVLAWFALMVNAAEHMPAADLAELEEWEARRDGVGSGGPTSDWPGWGRFINMDLFWPWPWHQGQGPGSEQPDPRRQEAPSTGFYLYRLWQDDGRLLYVGVSSRLRNRLTSHRRRWPALWSTATWESYPDAEAMLAAERVAIADEDPALNRAGIR